MAITLPCPRCQKPLEIPRPAPDQLRCDGCGAVIKNNARRPNNLTPVPAGETTAVAESAAAQSLSAESRGRLVQTPAARADAVAEPAAARSLATPSRERAPATAPSGNTGTVIAFTVGLLLVAGLGGVTAWVLLKEPEKPNVVADKSKKETPPEDDEDDPEEFRLSLTPFAKKERIKKDVDPRVRKAVDAGVAYLRSRAPARDAAFAKKELGMAALSGLTMLECGVDVEDADVQSLAQVIRDHAAELTTTYTAGPAILFLDRLHKNKSPPESDRKLIQTLALRLIHAQRRNGLWGYAAPALGKAAPKKKDKKDPYKEANKEEKLLADLRANTYEPTGAAAFDLSNSQFAALALWAARRHGVPVDPALRIAAKSVRAGQEKAGTWNYHMDNVSRNRDSGTCVGLILLALGKAVADDKDAKDDKQKIIDDPAVKRGLEHLGKVVRKDFKARKKAKGRLLGSDAGGDLYFLWALERTALILNIETIAGTDWHKWGSEIILQNQLPTGEWNDRFVGVPDTCFALLFLMQANLFQDLTDKLISVGGDGPQPAPQMAPPDPARKQD